MENARDEQKRMIGHLINLRKQRGLKIYQVADMSGGLIDKTSLSRIEDGKRSLSLKSAYALAKVYGISLNDLCNLAYGDIEDIVEAEGLADLDDREIDLIKKLRQLPADPKSEIIGFISRISKVLRNKNEHQ